VGYRHSKIEFVLALVLGLTLIMAPAAGDPSTTPEPGDGSALEVKVQGTRRVSARSVSDARIEGDRLDAAPHAQASEMLSTAPGVFVDHEEGEGLGNDIYVRGFDVEHGSGVEMRLGSIPLNIPMHLQGQGYAYLDFLIPEVVRSVRVLGGTYDPRQGNAALVGTAQFDLGVVERGSKLKVSFGSFHQMRVVGLIAPPSADEATFAAVALRKSDGFGDHRASVAASVIGQQALVSNSGMKLKLVASAHAAESELAGVVRADDIAAGHIGYYQSYPFFAQGQGVRAADGIIGLEFEHQGAAGGHFELAPWLMWTDFRARQNFTGNLGIGAQSSSPGDLFESSNREMAVGLTSRYRAPRLELTPDLALTVEPGVEVRGGTGSQRQSLLVPGDLSLWARRIDAGVKTLDAASYVDLELLLFDRLRISGGYRVDFLAASVADHWAVPLRHEIAGWAVSPRVSVEYTIGHILSPMISYGEGFRVVGASQVESAARPYAKVRSIEAGMRCQALSGDFSSTLALFETRTGDELVFEASEGGLASESASRRRGVVASLVAKPLRELLIASSLSVTQPRYIAARSDEARYVPNVPGIMFRVDAALRSSVGEWAHKPVLGRVGAGYTLLGMRHLDNETTGPAQHVLNAVASLRRESIELELVAYNLLGLKYADDAQVYASNWSTVPLQRPPSTATHITAAPPRSVIATLSVAFP
jgi:iron complex outermembrane receptor protein